MTAHTDSSHVHPLHLDPVLAVVARVRHGHQLCRVESLPRVLVSEATLRI